MNDAAQSLAVGSRERLLTETFVVLADTLVDDYDIVDLLDRLVASCVELLGVTAAGILLDDQQGSMAVVASSNEETRVLEVFELQNDEGPCLDCLRTSVAVASAELAADVDRWPLFVPQAVDAGFASVLAIPLRLRDQTIGALNMFDAQARSLSDDDQRLAQALADVATIGILQRRLAHRGTIVAEQLQHALNSRVIIEQAKGVMAERHSIDMESAFKSLRQHARHHNLKLTDVALAVVRDQLDVPVPVSAPGTGPATGPGTRGLAT